MLNVLYLYNSTQTYTNTVFEHIACFGKYSKHRSFYCHQDPTTTFNIDLALFDAVAIHFSVRLPYDHLSESTVEALAKFTGLKFLFIQDEYDNTHRAWHWIRKLGLQLVFTVVPAGGVEKVYPAREFPSTHFVSNLTGYVPDELDLDPAVKLPSQRSLIIGYRGRPLPIRYGRLGMEKIGIGKLVKSYCDTHNIENDIDWTEASRIYGPRWYEFMVSCRSMLGVESGSNVFDWDGMLDKRIAEYRTLHPYAKEEEIYEELVEHDEIDGIMNQVSPRVFEAIAAKTVLVLFEGSYSGVVKADLHFIAVKKDGSNLAEVMRLLHDGKYVDAIVERAHQDVIASGKYSYRTFVKLVDEQIECHLGALGFSRNILDPGRLVADVDVAHPVAMTSVPLRAPPPRPSTDTLSHTVFGAHGMKDLIRRFPIYLWWKLPEAARRLLRPPLKWLLR